MVVAAAGKDCFAASVFDPYGNTRGPQTEPQVCNSLDQIRKWQNFVWFSKVSHMGKCICFHGASGGSLTGDFPDAAGRKSVILLECAATLSSHHLVPNTEVTEVEEDACTIYRRSLSKFSVAPGRQSLKRGGERETAISYFAACQ